MADIPEKPTPPEPWECCGGGSCCPCVWDSHYKELDEWNEKYSQAPLDQTGSAIKP